MLLLTCVRRGLICVAVVVISDLLPVVRARGIIILAGVDGDLGMGASVRVGLCGSRWPTSAVGKGKRH